MQFLAHSMDKLASAFQLHQFKHLKEHVCGIGKGKFECKTFVDYFHIYNISDVITTKLIGTG